MLTPRQNIGADSRGQSNFNLDTSLDTRGCDDVLFMAVIMGTIHRHDCLEDGSSTVHPPGAGTAGLGGVSEADQGTDVVDVPGNDVTCHCDSPARDAQRTDYST